MSTAALVAAGAAGLSYRAIEHGPVGSLAQAARARGVAPADVVKTLVVRRGDDDFLFVLVPGDRITDAEGMLAQHVRVDAQGHGWVCVAKPGGHYVDLNPGEQQRGRGRPHRARGVRTCRHEAARSAHGPGCLA